MIEPLFQSLTALEVVARLVGRPGDSRDLVKGTWNSLSQDGWNEALRKGYLAGTHLPAAHPSFPPSPQSPPRGSLQVLFRLDPMVVDGQHANNPW